MGGTNPTASYAKLDNTTFSFSAYKAGIDANSVAALRIVGAFLPHAQTSPNMTIAVDAGHLFNGTTLTEVAAQNTGAITAPVVHPRIDRVVIDASGTASVVTGTEAVSPVAPAIPTGKSPIAQIALATSTTSITGTIITDERDFSALNVGGFGTQSAISSASTCDIGTLSSHNAKITGTTTITSFGSSASTAQPVYLVEFTGVLQLTYNATTMILPGGANITTTAGDTAILEYLGSGNWRVRSYFRAAVGPSTRFIVNQQWFAAGSSTYTPTTGAKTADIEMCAAGGGGGGGSSSAGVGSSGTDAADTTFTGGLYVALTAGGGKLGTGSGNGTTGLAGHSGADGTATNGTLNLTGAGSLGGYDGPCDQNQHGKAGRGGAGARCIALGVDISAGGTATVVVGAPGTGGAPGSGGVALVGGTGASGYVKITEWSA